MRDPLIRLATLPDALTHHLVISSGPTGLKCWLDGVATASTPAVTDPVGRWEDYKRDKAPSGFLSLNLGAIAHFGHEVWPGFIDALAIYNRPLEEAEAKQNYQAYAKILAQRKMPVQIIADAKLTAMSKVPRYQDVAPYRQALVVNEYQIAKVIDGQLSPARIRVAEWGLWDTKPAKRKRLHPGQAIPPPPRALGRQSRNGGAAPGGHAEGRRGCAALPARGGVDHGTHINAK